MLLMLANLLKFCVFYHVFIVDFAFIVQFIYAFLKKNVFFFIWEFVQQKIMNILKIVFINSFVFIFIDYTNDIIILAINMNLENWKKIFMILRNEKKHSIRYENEIWSNVEKKYDVIKKKCREIFKILKKIHFYFYDVKIILKINIRVLVNQLNRFDTNLFDAFVTRWFVWKFVQQETMNILKIVFINLFAFIFNNYENDVIILGMNASLED